MEIESLTEEEKQLVLNHRKQQQNWEPIRVKKGTLKEDIYCDCVDIQLNEDYQAYTAKRLMEDAKEEVKKLLANPTARKGTVFYLVKEGDKEYWTDAEDCIDVYEVEEFEALLDDVEPC